MSLYQNGAIDIEDFTKTIGKEVQLASWFSGIGEDVLIRNPDSALKNGKPTGDFLIAGDVYEAKRITSSNRKKIGTRINERDAKQGSKFIIDLSCSSMKREDAEAAIAFLLEDARVEEIILVKSGSAKRFKK